MKNTKKQFNICYSGFAFFTAFLIAQPSAKEIVEKADEARAPKGTFSFHVEVEDWEDAASSSKTGYKVYSKNEILTLIETISPERLLGRKLLMRDNDLWLYLPSVKRPTRISFQQKLTGKVANGDLARTLLARDYEATFLGMESIGGKENYKLSLKATNKEATYRSITYWVEKTTFYPSKMEFYAISGKLLKIGELSEPKISMGKMRMSKLAIHDTLAPAKKSIVTYSDYKSEKLEDSFFSKETLSE